MDVRKYRGMPYHLWNPFTAMEEFLPYLGFGTTIITRGDGPYIYNDRGKRYINGLSSLWNVAIGHGREELVQAASKQMRELAYSSCFGGQAHPRAIELAAKLVQITDGRFQHVYLGSNGSEAVETALKMARQYHQQSLNARDHDRQKIISLRGSYHGVSYGALSTSGSEKNRAKYGPLVPGFLQIEPPYCYRCPYGRDGYPGCGLECAIALEKIIQSEGPQTIAAFIMEPVMGDFGIVVPPDEFCRAVGETCQRHGLLFIADEVTTGFGRCGKLFASQDWDPRPDILCLGKAISSGYLPLSATLATHDIYEHFEGKGNFFAHGSTASGHPVCAAVGLANIDIIIKEKLADNAANVGAHLISRLKELADTHSIIGDVRGRGLMIGIELVKDREGKVPMDGEDTLNVGVDTAILGLAICCDVERSYLGLLPPLITDTKLADEMVEILDKSLDRGTAANIAQKARLAKEYASFKLGLGKEALG